MTETTTAAPRAQVEARIPAAAYWALALLGTANFLNYLDRQVVSILADSMKADLGLDDADLGFLMGTAFAVFYAVVGIAMGRISDGLSRKRVMAFGLALWSAMTAVGGLAQSFLVLAAARIGVGVGEAAANPCSHSLLAEIFPAKRRGIALSVYLVGTYAGTALSLVLGGVILQRWPTMCTAFPVSGACDLAPWRAALLIVGLPGLLVALLVLTIREPSRREARDKPPLAFVLSEFATALPPFTFFSVTQIGGRAALMRNLRLAAITVAVTLLLVLATGDVAQWVACAIGFYSVATWGQVQAMRDKPLYRLTFGDRTFVAAMAASALIACAGAGVGVWTAPYAMRTFAMPADRLGLMLGVTQTIGSILGVLLGGWLADTWKRRDLRAPLWIMGISGTCGIPLIVAMLMTRDFTAFIVIRFVWSITSSLWGGSTAAMIQDLVIPRMRGSAAGCFSLVSIVISSGIGPYWAGKISVWTGSLTFGLIALQVLIPVALVLLVVAARRIREDTPEARIALARSAGEPQD